MRKHVLRATTIARHQTAEQRISERAIQRFLQKKHNSLVVSDLRDSEVEIDAVYTKRDMQGYLDSGGAIPDRLVLYRCGDKAYLAAVELTATFSDRTMGRKAMQKGAFEAISLDTLLAFLAAKGKIFTQEQKAYLVERMPTYYHVRVSHSGELVETAYVDTTLSWA